MATPTPGTSKHPSSQVVATPPVSTPFSASNHPSHPAWSPHGPKSVVPSPQQVKKSPANSSTLFGYTGQGGHKMAAPMDHPTGSSLMGLGYDSPGGMLMGGMLDGMTPNTLAMVGVGVRGAGGRGDAEDGKRRRGEAVIEILKANKGRLSENGMERLAKRMGGLEYIWDNHMTSGGPTRQLVIAGKEVALEIDFACNVVTKVAISFPESPVIVTRHTKLAEDILFKDLELKAYENPLTKTLDKFAANFERLVALDKLSKRISCQEAIAGIYESLERLHNWDVERLLESDEMIGKDRDFVSRTALCTRSGRPAMHSRGRLGMSLDYWQDKRRLPTARKDESTWALLVECAYINNLSSLNGMVYPTLRVSEEWISKNIAKPSAEDIFSGMVPGHQSELDWLEPQVIIFPSGNVGKPEDIDEHDWQKFTEVMFVAKLDPPLVVPQSVAQQIFLKVDANMDGYHSVSYDSLLFPRGPEEAFDGEKRMLERETIVPVFKGGKKSTQVHHNILLVDKMDFGRLLTEIPFSHPRQLIEVVPRLRQYAFIARLLNKSFGPNSKPVANPKFNKNKRSKEVEYAKFMSSSSLSGGSEDGRIDVRLETQPVPRITVIFRLNHRRASVQAVFEVKLDGVVEIASQNILGSHSNATDEGKRKLGVKDLERMLEITENIGIWVEFVRMRLG